MSIPTFYTMRFRFEFVFRIGFEFPKIFEWIRNPNRISSKIWRIQRTPPNPASNLHHNATHIQSNFNKTTLGLHRCSTTSTIHILHASHPTGAFHSSIILRNQNLESESINNFQPIRFGIRILIPLQKMEHPFWYKLKKFHQKIIILHFNFFFSLQPFFLSSLFTIH